MTLTPMSSCEREILILCPSRKRARTCTTHKVLPSVRYFVDADEYDEYVRHVGEKSVVKVPDGLQVAPAGKCRTLNWLLDNYKTDDNIVLFTDDDIKAVSRIDFLKKRESKQCTETELFSLLRKMAVIAKGMGAKIGGFCTVGGDKDFIAMGGTNGYVFTEKSYIDGKAFIIFEDDGTRYDEELYLKEDIDFNCQSLKKNKCTLSAKFVVFVGRALNNSGGVVDVRTTQEELRQGAQMIDKHGGMLKLQISRAGNGVRKNAVQFGIK